jgi:hypothetical protein
MLGPVCSLHSWLACIRLAHFGGRGTYWVMDERVFWLDESNETHDGLLEMNDSDSLYTCASSGFLCVSARDGWNVTVVERAQLNRNMSTNIE